MRLKDKSKNIHWRHFFGPPSNLYNNIILMYKNMMMEIQSSLKW